MSEHTPVGCPVYDLLFECRDTLYDFAVDTGELKRNWTDTALSLASHVDDWLVKAQQTCRCGQPYQAHEILPDSFGTLVAGAWHGDSFKLCK